MSFFSTAIIIIIVPIVAGLVGLGAVIIFCIWYVKKYGPPKFNFFSGASQPFSTFPDSRIRITPVEKFLKEIAREKPIRFSPQQLAGFTLNYATKLGSGGFGAVYKGELPNGMFIAVKVLNGNAGKAVEEQFMAEVGTIGRTYHKHLVRLFGFCFNPMVTALVYEYMENGSLDKYLFNKNHEIEWGKLHEIAIGTAKGIRYLHEECPRRIVHFDIKPGNILLDSNFSPKVADFGLAKLCNMEKTHEILPGGRGTLGYAAPEMWTQPQVTYEADVYSFGILLFEIVGRRRHYDINMTESKEWLPKWIWQKFEDGQLGEMASVCGIEEENKEEAEKMCKVALWCVQYQPEARPPMSTVVKMLEGEKEITTPMNPFQHLVSSNTPFDHLWRESATNSTETGGTSQTGVEDYAPLMRKYEIEIATSS